MTQWPPVRSLPRHFLLALQQVGPCPEPASSTVGSHSVLSPGLCWEVPGAGPTCRAAGSSLPPDPGAFAWQVSLLRGVRAGACRLVEQEGWSGPCREQVVLDFIPVRWGCWRVLVGVVLGAECCGKQAGEAGCSVAVARAVNWQVDAVGIC